MVANKIGEIDGKDVFLDVRGTVQNGFNIVCLYEDGTILLDKKGPQLYCLMLGVSDTLTETYGDKLKLIEKK